MLLALYQGQGYRMNSSLPSPVCGGRWPEGPEGGSCDHIRATDGPEHEDPIRRYAPPSPADGGRHEFRHNLRL